MKLQFIARHGSVPQHFRDHAEPRLEHLDQYAAGIDEARVSLSEQRGRLTVEITVHTRRAIFRSEKTASDALEAFDTACAAIEKQLRRHRRRVKDHTRTSVRKLEAATEVTDEADSEEGSEAGAGIVRTKRHRTKPMAPEEAAMQMEMVGHDFFLFIDSATKETAAVYRRKAGGYGLIELELG